ncbi:MAG: hypothetical protein GFGODING_03209 [Flavobacteriales bacterium]|nr:hypothetical protein [Flavobacteriales bacterium]
MPALVAAWNAQLRPGVSGVAPHGLSFNGGGGARPMLKVPGQGLLGVGQVSNQM